jgi:hypothetical protein
LGRASAFAISFGAHGCASPTMFCDHREHMKIKAYRPIILSQSDTNTIVL